MARNLKKVVYITDIYKRIFGDLRILFYVQSIHLKKIVVWYMKYPRNTLCCMARLFFRSDERLINLPVYPVNLPLKVMCDLIGASSRVDKSAISLDQ